MRTLIRWIVVVVVIVHGLIHLLGAVKGFGWVDVSQLAEPIGSAMGAAWLAAAVLMVVTGVMLAIGSRGWWIVGAVAAVASQVVIMTSWSDAKAGTLANVILLTAVVYGCASQGPWSHHTEYLRRVDVALAEPGSGAIVTEDDLAHLPAPLADYVRSSGAVGLPRVASFTPVYTAASAAAPPGRG